MQDFSLGEVLFHSEVQGQKLPKNRPGFKVGVGPGHYPTLGPSDCHISPVHTTVYRNTYVSNILHPSFVGPFDFISPRQLPTVPIP